MAQKLTGRLNLSRIPRELIQTTQNGEKCVYIEVVPNRNGADQYGNTHSVSIYDKANKKPIYLGNLKPQDFGQGGQAQGGNSHSDDLPWEK